jgi:HEAT repeat protein
MHENWLISHLKKAAAEDDQEGIRSAADALVEKGSSAVPKLVVLWADRDFTRWRLYESVSEIIVRMGEQAVPHLIESLDHFNMFVPGYAMDALAKIGGPAIPELMEGLVHGKQKVRKNSAKALNMMVDRCKGREELVDAETLMLDNIDALAGAGMGSIRQDAELVADQLVGKLSRKILAHGPQKDSFLQDSPKPPRRDKRAAKAGQRQLPLFR